MVDVVVTLAAGQTHPVVPEANNNNTTNGHDKGSVTNGASNAANSESFFRDIDVRIPKEIVEQGVRSLKDSLRSFATIEDDDDGPEADEKEFTNGKATKSEKKNKSSGNKDSSSNGNPSPMKNSAGGKDKKSKSGKDAK
ncbi:hypothetical protein EYB25_000451 [Talaromyces marneffei]|nr:hypothetical protein EYB25_000451 [Talaromyces marneffei]